MTKRNIRDLLIGCITASLFSVTDNIQAAGLGLTSHDSALVSITVPKRVSIEGLENFEFDEWNQDQGTVTKTNKICIYSNTSGNYNVTATSQSSNGSNFQMKRDIDNSTLSYEVSLKDSANSSTYESSYALNQGEEVKRSGANSTNPSCDNNFTASLAIKILASELEKVPGSEENFTDILTLNISPI